MVLPDAATARVLRTQPEIARAIQAYPKVTKAVVGIGAWEPGLSTVADSVSEAEREESLTAGVCGELSGVQFDEHGAPVVTSLTDRLIGIDAQRLHAVPEVIAIAYGAPKAAAVRAAIRGGFVTSLVTHTAMGHALLELA
jgi:DNA-binding transcriptional regulator LsrR (DeoR family)